MHHGAADRTDVVTCIAGLCACCVCCAAQNRAVTERCYCTATLQKLAAVGAHLVAGIAALGAGGILSVLDDCVRMRARRRNDHPSLRVKPVGALRHQAISNCDFIFSVMYDRLICRTDVVIGSIQNH